MSYGNEAFLSAIQIATPPSSGPSDSPFVVAPEKSKTHSDQSYIDEKSRRQHGVLGTTHTYFFQQRKTLRRCDEYLLDPDVHKTERETYGFLDFTGNIGDLLDFLSKFFSRMIPLPCQESTG